MNISEWVRGEGEIGAVGGDGEGSSRYEQIFVLREIVETNTDEFINFKKAFDCIHRESLWTVVAIYGIPDEIIGIMNHRSASVCQMVDNCRITVSHLHRGVAV